MASTEYPYSSLDQNTLEGEIDSEDASTSSLKAVGEIPDGGVVAWLQVAAAFCINLSTW